MSDDHTGLPHDLPEYVPNWPLPVKVKAVVAKGAEGCWLWFHPCPRKDGWSLVHCYVSQSAAFEAALKHARGCW